MQYRIQIIFILIITSHASSKQNETQFLPDNMPLHTKIIWGEKGIFRKLNISPNTRQKELQLRIKMLQLHQKLAFGTLGMFFYQTYLGNHLLDGNLEYRDRHSKMSKIVWSSYMLSASFSYLAPPGMVYTKKVNSMKIHRLLSWVHFVGMASLPILGNNISNSADYNKAVQLHQSVAYATLFTMSFSGLLTIFPY